MTDTKLHDDTTINLDAYEAGLNAWKAGCPALPPIELEPVLRAFWAWGWLNAQQHFNARFPKGDARYGPEAVRMMMGRK